MLKKIQHEIKYVKSIIREKSKSKKRSSRWDEVRDDFILSHPTCAACGSINRLQVHHILPFHLHPELELEESNLITLCMDIEECHLNIGHGGSYKCYNPSVIKNAKEYLNNKDKSKRNLIVESCRNTRKEADQAPLSSGSSSSSSSSSSSNAGSKNPP